MYESPPIQRAESFGIPWGKEGWEDDRSMDSVPTGERSARASRSTVGVPRGRRQDRLIDTILCKIYTVMSHYTFMGLCSSIHLSFYNKMTPTSGSPNR